MKNIVLVGFMGTGKTSVGKMLSMCLDKPYISVDDIIEKKEGLSITDIFAGKGEEYFRKLESEIIREISGREDQIIDTGGGAVLNEGNIAALKRSGVLFCLTALPETIYNRVKEQAHRPLLKVDDPRKKVAELLSVRKQFYEMADHMVPTDDLDVAHISGRIIDVLNRLESEKEIPDVSGYFAGLYGLLINKIFHYASVPIMITSGEGDVCFANSEFIEIFGLGFADIRGKCWIDLVVPQNNRNEAREKFSSIMEYGKAIKFTILVSDKTGRTRFYNWIVDTLVSGGEKHLIFAGLNCHDTVGLDINVQPAAAQEMIDRIFSMSWDEDLETSKHSMKVMVYSLELADRIGLPEKEKEILRSAALLHDIGKIAMNEKILLKDGKLDDIEYEHIKNHIKYGVDMIRPVNILEEILPVIDSHHENYDGSGYPKGLKREEISLPARILSIADIFDALTSLRPYRRSFPIEEAIRIMRKEKGKKLDPELTDIFIELVKNGSMDAKIRNIDDKNGYKR
ncbi:MAG: HD domain-containing protein [Candidatus Omnitrophica bacterium]|nr:HD domain-containing protein [Candidatus Omnitrophota bacterium]